MDYKFATVLIISAQICAIFAHPPCTCTRNYTPVCGSDGKTYSNACTLECAAYTSGTEITVAKHEKCDDSNQIPGVEPSCICTFIYKPVCGTDEQTYSNECELNCHKKSNDESLKIKHEGVCESSGESGCVCPALHRPVCGSDGNTYSNDCELNCATKDNSQLSVAHSGDCVDKVKVVDSLFQY